MSDPINTEKLSVELITITTENAPVKKKRKCTSIFKFITEILFWFRGKESACQAGDESSIPGSGRTPQEGNDNPLLYSCLGNPMDRAWQATIHGVTRMIDMI